jgi:hypothetical protein
MYELPGWKVHLQRRFFLQYNVQPEANYLMSRKVSSELDLHVNYQILSWNVYQSMLAITLILIPLQHVQRVTRGSPVVIAWVITIAQICCANPAQVMLRKLSQSSLFLF